MTNQINKMMTVDSHIASKVMNMHFPLHLYLVLPSVAGLLANNSIKKVMQISKSMSLYEKAHNRNFEDKYSTFFVNFTSNCFVL